jgi:hypothetical protein
LEKERWGDVYNDMIDAMKASNATYLLRFSISITWAGSLDRLGGYAVSIVVVHVRSLHYDM